MGFFNLDLPKNHTIYHHFGPVIVKLSPILELNIADRPGIIAYRQFKDSNNISIGIHFFKVLVQIHYSRSPGAPGGADARLRVKTRP